MSIRLANSIHARRHRLGGTLTTSRMRAANDNALPHFDDGMLVETLRHFARHGLAAAAQARRLAEQARQAGNEEAYAHWSEICRALDRRMGRELAAHANAN